MLDVANEYSAVAVAADDELAVLDRGLASAGFEGADEDDLFGVLADVDEAAGAGESGAELADVDVAGCVGLGAGCVGLVPGCVGLGVGCVGLVLGCVGRVPGCVGFG